MFVLLALLAFAGCSIDYQTLFNEFIDEQKRSYFGSEYEAKFEIFKQNVDKITELNNKYFPKTTFGINEFADMSDVEFRSQYCQYIDGNKKKVYGERLTGETPNEIDWREKGYVTNVKDQAQCGSCWAFSATGCMEGAWVAAGNELTSFSEQQLVDCDKTDAGCNGGLMDNAFDYAIAHGMEKESDYKYVAHKRLWCHYKKESVVGKFQNYSDIPDEDQMEQYVATYGPISVALDADILQFYTGGVISGGCGTQLDHGVLAVGYKDNYWIVKNSWGKTWGENGYFRIEKGKDECGISQASSIIFA